MTYQNLKSDKEQFKIQFEKRIKLFIFDLIKFIEALPESRTIRMVSDQLIRSGTSIGANYFEARAASSRNDFANFFRHSLKSANESKFWLEILIENNKGNAQEANKLLKEVAEIANIFGSSLLTLKSVGNNF